MWRIIGWLYCFFLCIYRVLCATLFQAYEIWYYWYHIRRSYSAYWLENKYQYIRLKHCPFTSVTLYKATTLESGRQNLVFDTFIKDIHEEVLYGENGDAHVFRITVYILINRHWRSVVHSPFTNVFYLLREAARSWILIVVLYYLVA